MYTCCGHLLNHPKKSVEEIRWNWLDEKMEFNYFSAIAVFIYAIKLASVERWMFLSEEKGQEMLDKLINQITTSVKF